MWAQWSFQYLIGTFYPAGTYVIHPWQPDGKLYKCLVDNVGSIGGLPAATGDPSYNENWERIDAYPTIDGGAYPASLFPGDRAKLFAYSNPNLSEHCRIVGNYNVDPPAPIDYGSGEGTMVVGDDPFGKPVYDKWVTDHNYSEGDVVISGEKDYYCWADHTSSSHNQPGVGPYWRQGWADGVGT